MLNPDDFYLVFWRYPKEDGTMYRRLLGKFALDGNHLHVVSDYHHMLSHLPHDGIMSKSQQRALESLFHSSYIEVVKKSDITAGLRPDLISAVNDAQESEPLAEPPSMDQTQEDANGGKQEPVVGTAPQGPSRRFEYFREGMDRPHIIEFCKDGSVTLDGTALSAGEAHQVLRNVKNGTATLRYAAEEVQLQKMAKAMEELAKAEDLNSSMESLKALVAAGHLPQEHFDRIRRELYHDEMIPEIGNKRAYHDHLKAEGRGGVHIMLDANDFKSINDDLSHEHGDQAIKAMGGALRSAVDNTVGPSAAKIHRFGGDEFHIHVQNHEHAGMVLRALRHHLEAVPPVGGTHKLSMSAGIGADVHSADHALNVGAKGMKKQAVAALGGDPEARAGKVRAPHALYAHSTVPGHEGPMPMEENMPPVQPQSSPATPKTNLQAA